MRETNQFYTGDEYQRRLGVYLANKRFVQEHNAKNLGFTVALNKFAAYTPAEYKSLLGFKPIQTSEPATKETAPTAATVDWRTKNVVNAIKDQGQCGSCWAFSTVQTIESIYAINKGKLYSFSEQNLVDCVTTCYGCDGGLMTSALTYVANKQGGKIHTESDYKYTATAGTCKFSSSTAFAAGVSGYSSVTAGSETDLASKCQTYGPIAIAIDASNWSFQLYSSGIYDESACSSSNLDHGVGCVGYGTEGSTNYWIVRNSWGTSWGESGYIRMVKDKKNQCGEASMACYAKF
jgi:cathepsin L